MATSLLVLVFTWLLLSMSYQTTSPLDVSNSFYCLSIVYPDTPSLPLSLFLSLPPSHISIRRQLSFIREFDHVAHPWKPQPAGILPAYL